MKITGLTNFQIYKSKKFHLSLQKFPAVRYMKLTCLYMRNCAKSYIEIFMQVIALLEYLNPLQTICAIFTC